MNAAESLIATARAAGIDVFEQMGHCMHGQDPQLFTETLVDWVSKQPTSR